MNHWINTFRRQIERVWQPSQPQPQLDTEPLPLGTIVSGRFKITAVLGQGGFGRTYRAAHLNRFGEEVALKEFAPDRRYVKDLNKAQELFEREAQVLFALNHPQIPQFLENVIDRQGQSDRFFIIQEFISGKSYQFIGETQYRSGFPVAEVKQLLLDVLPVLAYLHQQRPAIIHRDISPDNILRCNETGLPKLVDFGAVKMVLQSVTKNHRNTIVGKLGYAPPEQQLGKAPVNAASDLYSLGATAIALLTGKSPLQLQGIYGTWQWRDALAQPIDDRFAQVLDQMVLLHQHDRFQSAQDVLTALQDPQGSPPQPSAPSAPEPRQLVYFQEAPLPSSQKTQKTKVAAPFRSRGSITPPPRSPSMIPDPILEFFKFFLTPEFRRFAQRQVFWVGGLTIVIIMPFFVGDAIDNWRNRPESPEDREDTRSGNRQDTVGENTSECDRFNTEYIERQINETDPYLMLDIDDAFYAQYPELKGETLEEGDPRMEDWCAIGNEFLAEP